MGPTSGERTRMRLFVLAMAWSAAAAVRAQPIPIRTLSAPERVSTEKLDATSGVRPLSNGRVIVASRRKVLVFDSTLASFSVVTDSGRLTSGSTQAFQIAIIPALADSTLVVDVNASGFLMVDPVGRLARVMAAPIAGDIRTISSAIGIGSALVDPKGRLVYRGSYPRPPNVERGTQTSLLAAPDSFPIVRADFDTRIADTVAVVRMPSGIQASMTITDGRMLMRTVRQPYPTTDAWTALTDGSIVIVRGADYHIDWISPSGVKTSFPKMPFTWLRISDDEKVRIVDSLTKFNASANARADSLALRPASNTVIQRMEIVAPKEIPDYYPPVRDGGVRADAEGNVWVLPATSASAGGGLLYDVINRKGELFERVQLPSTCALGGFAPARVVYLLCTPPGPPRANATTLERRRIVH